MYIFIKVEYFLCFNPVNEFFKNFEVVVLSSPFVRENVDLEWRMVIFINIDCQPCFLLKIRREDQIEVKKTMIFGLLHLRLIVDQVEHELVLLRLRVE